MNHFYLAIVLLITMPLFASAQLSGKVVSEETNDALAGASLYLQKAGKTTISNDKGEYSFAEIISSDTLIVSYMGYLPKRLAVSSATIYLDIFLESDPASLEAVEINTGFYQIPKERATGSFTLVDNKLLNRAVGGNIFQRLEGVASGVQFVNANGTSASDIRIRGLATIQSDETPLIVVDNFPYEGNIDNIDPNNIESISILKDAAAASIWGARAGNGVIVITTKKGLYNQKSFVSFNNSITIGEKPDLFYDQNRLPSDIVMQIEKEKYEKGGYYKEAANQAAFPDYVELLIKLDKGKISKDDFLIQEDRMKRTEVRDEALKYLYQPSVYQQNSLNLRGGSENHTYNLSSGYDQDRATIIGNENSRWNINFQNTYKPFKNVELAAGIGYTEAVGTNNGIGLRDLDAGLGIYLSPYISLLDEVGNALPIVKDYRNAYKDDAEKKGLLDWQYRPLEDRALVDKKSKRDELRLNGGLRYNFLNYFNINAIYQFVKEGNQSTSLYHKDSYYVRNMANRYTQSNGSLLIPHNSIFNSSSPSSSVSHSARAQLNYNQSLGNNHVINALVGGDIRSFTQDIHPGHVLYNYDVELMTGTAFYNYTQIYDVQPSGRARIPEPYQNKRRFVDRYLSYFGNASYTYKQRYILSSSMRWDGSNLFGVKTNQKGTPLWSTGFSWEVSKEGFYDLHWLPYLRFRATYGSSGNVNKNVSAFPVVSYSIDGVSQLQYAQITSIGNPSLRWEQVNTMNLGADWRSKSNRISGSLEYYKKWAEDLIGADYLAPSTGIITGGTATRMNLINYANLETKGIDLQIDSRNIRGAIHWNSSFLLSFVKNKITHFNTGEVPTISNYFSNPQPIIGRSRDVVYALPWYGLDPVDGSPIMFIDDTKTKDYQKYIQSRNIENLVIAGNSVPGLFGSFRNEVGYNGFVLSALLSWKGDYVFRRKSISPGEEYNATYHLDYLKRWQKPGDEVYTNIPAGLSEIPAYSATVNSNSEILITKGNHIRLQDINLSYSLTNIQLGKIPIQGIRLYAYARNLGILWRENRNGIDPDYSRADYPAPRTVALGLQVDF